MVFVCLVDWFFLYLFFLSIWYWRSKTAGHAFSPPVSPLPLSRSLSPSRTLPQLQTSGPTPNTWSCDKGRMKLPKLQRNSRVASSSCHSLVLPPSPWNVTSGFSSPEPSMILLSSPKSQVETSRSFVKIDFIIIKCLFKQMPPPFLTPGEQGGGGSSVK